jgi:hypothetical protein
MIGVRLKRMLTRRGVLARIGALMQALEHLDAYAALIVKRVARNLTRRFLCLIAIDWPLRIPALSLSTPATCFADSS